ncbi:hypothetical protein HF888_16485 (plasmid) [Bermanella marisrubri]|uniref:Uncharacterized protein n=1 Tax=Bermanella marisrubri TaxID=207949 RepID=Q1MY08_9GAMM|nr:hypothetical protein [Bermanella marisrubri]EAT10888.1 hypothetical protein RED65_02078 [Oceanobacter sp. RED65] [Bermanella marisrubri]QIZ85938.1 hypothetical protein HF888_16485 [Bermanella marisrubri]
MREFFQPSDHVLKLRRNLLFLCVTYIVHILVQPLTKLKVFEVHIPSELLNLGFPIFISWMAVNYFYYLYAERIQWQSLFIDDELKKDYMVDGVVETLVPVITKLRPGSFSLDTNISGRGPDMYEKQLPSGAERVVLEDMENADRLKEAFQSLNENWNKRVKQDLKLLRGYSSAFSRYHLANKFRFWILDNAIPFLVLVFVVVLIINEAFGFWCYS